MLPLEHHFLRTAAATPLRLFSELDMDNNNLMNSIEKARILHQQWGARAAAAAAVAGAYPGAGGGPGGGGGGGGPGGGNHNDQSSLHHLLAAANSAAAAAAASGPCSLPQLFTLNPTRGSPSPLPLPAHLWSQWSALSQLPPGLLSQASHAHHLQQQHQQQQQQQQHHLHQSPHNLPSSGMNSNGSTTNASNSPGSNRGRSPINLRYTPYPPPMSAKASSSSPNPGSIPPSLINESIGVTINSSRS